MKYHPCSWRSLALLAVGGATISLFSGGCQPVATTADATAHSDSQFTTEIVKQQDLTGLSFFDGKLIVPESAKATAFSPYDAPVVDVLTGVGKTVKRGETIVKMTIPGADSAAASAKANVSATQAEYSTKRSDASAPVRDAEQSLADARAAEKAAKDSAANGGQADVGAATQARIDAESRLQQARLDLRQSLQPDKLAVDQAATTLREAKMDAAKGIVRAPISGTIMTLDAKPGLMATAKLTLATIINFNAVRVQGVVPPDLKTKVVKRSHVIVTMTGPSADPIDGTVVDVDVLAPGAGQKSPGYVAVIQLLNPTGMAQPNLSVKRIGVETGKAKNVIVVASSAISTVGGKSTVNVQNGDKWVETPVELGLTDGVLTEIKSGLTKGQVVRVNSTTASHG